MLKKITLSALLILSQISPSFAAATEADVKYSQDVIALTQEFAKVVTTWTAAVSNPPTFSIGNKYNNWKKGAIGASTKMQATVSKFANLKPTPGLAVSDALLKKACKEYSLGLTNFIQALNKNDKKLADKASNSLVNASKSYSAWVTAYATDIKAING